MYFESINNSYYIRAGRNEIFIKCLETDDWGVFGSNIGIGINNRIAQIEYISGNIDIPDSWMKEAYIKKVNSFAHKRVVFSDFEYAEMFLRELIKMFKVKWYSTTHKVFFHLDYVPEGGLSDIEERAIRDSIEHIGAKELYFLESGSLVSEIQVKGLFEYIINKRFKKVENLPQELKILLLKGDKKIPTPFLNSKFKSY